MTDKFKNTELITETNSKTRKALEDLTIKDDFMFGVVYSRSLYLAKRLAEYAIGYPIAKVRFHNAQVTVNDFYNSKGIRLDILLVGATEWIDLEMQNQKVDEIIQRNQYYTSLMTVDSLQTGMEYSNLPRIISIFITSFDPFGLGYEKYICLESLYGENSNGIKEDITEKANYDGRYAKIYLNVGNILPKYRVQNEELRNALDYFRTNIPTDTYTEELNQKVKEAKVDASVRREFMTLEDKINIEREEAKAEGLVEGKQNKAIEVAKEMLASKTMSKEIISQFTHLSIKEIEEIEKTLNK